LARIDKLGLVNHIIKITQETDATIKIITTLSQEISEIVDRINKREPSIRILNSDSNSVFGMCIIAIYSNRKLTMNSFKSIFGLLWNERILNEQLKVHDKMQNEFINIAAHELRTPIQSILGNSELLKNSKLLKEDKTKKCIAIYNSNIQKCSKA
jgi:two-component system sensor histidine kinase VicK